MKQCFGFLLLILLFGASCNVIGQTGGSCKENDTAYEPVREPDPNTGRGYYTGQCEDEEGD